MVSRIMVKENEKEQSILEISVVRKWRKNANKALKKARAKIQKQEKELEEVKKWQWFGQIADSLLADPDAYNKGEAQRDIINVHTQEIENVRLNPKCDAYRNAELYYKKARKGKRGFDAAMQKVSDSRMEIEEIESFITGCDKVIEKWSDEQSFDEKEITELATAAKKYETDSSTGAGGGEEKRHNVPYRHFRLQNFDIYIGKTDAQNDELSTRFARPWDLWLHVAGHAGSHVVIRREKSSPWPPHSILEDAGALAVWFSKAKHTSYAEVHVTEARFVRKPRKSPPGQVIAERCKTVRVAPKSPQEMFPGLYD